MDIVIFVKIFIHVHHKRRNKGKCVFFIATPVYHNLGDYAIVYAQLQLFKDINADDYIIELTRFEYEKYRKLLDQFVIKADDPIIIDGGGNIGTLWPEEENKIRDIITRFPNNPIYIFPQTAFFEDSKNGNDELEKSISIYNSHPNLTIFCRDSDTFLLMKKYFTNSTAYYSPDIVMYLNQTYDQLRRNVCLLCLRDDKESIRDSSVEKTVRDYFSKKKYLVYQTTTIASVNVNRRNRFKLLCNKWSEFSSVKLVVTDRLHGMIFAAITGTPCLAFDNLSHKVKNGYDWIKDLKYIMFCEDFNQTKTVLNKMDKLLNKRFVYSKNQVEQEFNLIKEILEHEIFS